jgi:uncharacterized protein (DUF2062 family)
MRLTRPAAAVIVTLTCLSLVTPASAAQRRPAPANAAASQEATASPRADGATAEETRRDLENLLRQYPPALPRILRLDPSLVGNPAYLEPYPALATFLAQHPEIGHNPGYFFAEYDSNSGDPRYRQTAQERAVNMWREAIQGLTIGTVLLAIGSGVIWLIKTLIDYRRWSRLSKIQTDVHNKLLDRFTSNEDLLAYIQTPAGKRFLESAPIAVESPRSIGAPLGRILWSAQAGAVLTVLGIGIEVVSSNALEEIAPPLAAFGAVVIALGVGFLVSAVLAYILTRRFGLLNDPNAAAPDTRG